MFPDWAVGAGFECVESVGVYWLGVGEDGVTVAGWFSLLHVLLPYTTFVVLGNIDSLVTFYNIFHNFPVVSIRNFLNATPLIGMAFKVGRAISACTARPMARPDTMRSQVGLL